MTQLARGAREALEVLDSLLREAIDDLDDAHNIVKRDPDEVRRLCRRAQQRIRDARAGLEDDLAPRLIRQENRNLAAQIAELKDRLDKAGIA